MDICAVMRCSAELLCCLSIRRLSHRANVVFWGSCPLYRAMPYTSKCRHLRRRREQCLRVFMLWRGCDLLGLTRLDNFTSAHHGYTCREISDNRHRMGNEEVGEPELALQLREQVNNLRTYTHVESGYRFVEDQKARLERKRSGNADALALSSRELMRITVQRRLLQPYCTQQLAHPLPMIRGSIWRSVVGRMDNPRFANDVEDAHARI